MVLQEYSLPSQHAYRSMRRRNARESKDTEMLNLKLELGQLKHELATVHDEVYSWRSWYDVSYFAYADAELVEGSAETEAGTNKHELPTKSATELQEVSSGIDILLRELTSLRAGALDESTDMGSIASGSGIDSNISEMHHAGADLRKTNADCAWVKAEAASGINTQCQLWLRQWSKSSLKRGAAKHGDRRGSTKLGWSWRKSRTRE